MSERITIQEKLDYEFEYDGKKHEVEITPELIFVPDIGDYNGHMIRLYGGDAEHMCGLMGYNPMLGDDCPACDAGTYKDNFMSALTKQLRLEGILEKYK